MIKKTLTVVGIIAIFAIIFFSNSFHSSFLTANTSRSLAPLAALPSSVEPIGTPDSLDLGMTPNDDRVLASAVQPDGKIIVAGHFSSALGVARGNVARINTDRTLDAVFNPNVNGDVRSIAVQADGKILIGGEFTQIQANGASVPTNRGYLARLNSDGSLDNTFNPTYLGNTVYSVTLQADGKILIGGFFTSPNHGVARLNTDGSFDSSFIPTINGNVNSIIVQPDQKILVAGGFTTPRQQVIRFNPNGTIDAGFNPPSSFDIAIVSIALQSDGKVLIGGSFNPYIARLNSDGTLDSSFNSSINNGVSSLALQTDGKLLVGGGFTSPVKRLARLNSDGSADSPFDTNPNNVLSSVGLQADGKILASGFFSQIGIPSTNRGSFARLFNNSVTQNLSVPDTSQVVWTRSGAGPEVSQVAFEFSPDNFSWSPVGNGSRVGTSNNWTLSDLFLPTNGYIRATGRTNDGRSSGLIQQASYFTATQVTYPFTGTVISGSGTINPSGTINVNRGANQVFNISAGTDNRIDQVLVDGSPVTLPYNPIADYSYTFLVATSSHSISASFVSLTPFEKWQLAHFTQLELASSTISNATSSPDGDGISNLMEYAFNTDPKVNGPSYFIYGNVNGFFTLQYRENLNATDLTYTIETSTNLNTWTATTTNNAFTSIDSNTRLVTASAQYPISGNMFFRLKITKAGGQPIPPTFLSPSVSSAFKLTVTKSGLGNVTSLSGNINCGSTCAFSAFNGATETLTAQADTDYQFDGWSGACSGTGTCQITLNSAKQVTASFSQVVTNNTVNMCFRGRTIVVPGYLVSRYIAAGATAGPCN